MKGKVIDYSVQENTGLISGDDGKRYPFVGLNWKESDAPIKGMAVDFEIHGSEATGIYKDVTASSFSELTGEKNKVVAGILALLVGGLGIHKFYLGYTASGLVYLLTNTIGLLVTWILFGLPNVALAVIAVVEGVIYLTKTDAEFEQTYVQGKKTWF